MNMPTSEQLREAEQSARSLSLSIVLAVIAAVALTGFLASCGTVQEQYREADRATFDSLAPWVRAKADPVADESKLLVLDSWELRLKTAEGK